MPGMILLEPGNRILREVLEYQLTSTKIGVIDVKLCDFDDVKFRVVTNEQNEEFVVCMGLPCYDSIKDFGAEDALKEAFGDMLTDESAVEELLDGKGEQPKDVFVRISATDNDVKVDDVCEKVSLLKAITIGGVFQRFFGPLGSGGSLPEPFAFDLRPDTRVFLVPSKNGDRVNVTFQMAFNEEVDNVIAGIFMQEFVDARKTLRGGPPVQFGKQPSLEVKESGLKIAGGDSLGFVGFSVMKEHVKDTDRTKKIINSLQTFRNYIQYHLKCSKSYFHQRMRLRVKELLLILNRAKMSEEESGKKKVRKTAGGKTWRGK